MIATSTCEEEHVVDDFIHSGIGAVELTHETYVGTLDVQLSDVRHTQVEFGYSEEEGVVSVESGLIGNVG